MFPATAMTAGDIRAELERLNIVWDALPVLMPGDRGLYDRIVELETELRRRDPDRT